MTGRATDFDAALTGGLGEWPRKSAGGAGKSGWPTRVSGRRSCWCIRNVGRP